MLKAFINRHYKLLETLEILLVVFLIYGLPVIYFLGGRCSVCLSGEHIIHSFWEQIEEWHYDYDEMLAAYGTDYESTVKQIEGGAYNIDIEYEPLVFHFAGHDIDDPDEWHIYALTIKDKSIRLNNGLHVGVPKLWIKWIFRHQMHYDYRPDAYMNGIDEAVEFSYDKLGRVQEITYCLSI